MGMTMAEKIFARASGRPDVVPGQFVTGRVDLALLHDIFAVPAFDLLRGSGFASVWDRARVVVVLDHLVPSPSVAAAEVHRRIRDYVRGFEILHFFDAGTGICHQLVAEQGLAQPGQLLVGTDSHTTTAGALGIGGTGVGTSEMAYVLATGELWFQVPPTILVELAGRLAAGVMWKDVVLALAGQIGTDGAQYQALEFGGPAAGAVDVAGRLTIANMAVELGAKFGLFPADDGTLRHYRQLGIDVDAFGPDADARYARTVRIQLETLGPQVAVPHAVDRVKPVEAVEGTPIDQAFLGSCTNGRLEDLRVAARILAGHRVHPRTRLLVAPASWQVERQAMAEGLLETLVDAGALLMPAGCGPCFGGHGGVLAAGERCIGTHNRNFPGRMGSPQAEIFLASPATVAATAIRGRITDPRRLLCPVPRGPWRARGTGLGLGPPAQEIP